MPRANRIIHRGLVWHLTHRCHKKSFLLKFARDRRRWRHWLWVARKRFGFCVLNYVATSNHVHLLVQDQGRREISKSMQLVAARTAQEYNRRRSRNGAFWEDRYHATAVQTDRHLVRCLVYIDLNMVRARAVDHPREWEISGYHEIQKPRARKGVIDHVALRMLCDIENQVQLQKAHRRWVSEALPTTRRDSRWTDSPAVGDEYFLPKIDGLRVG
jgi:putative transposase